MNYLYEALYIFFTVLEIILFIYVIATWFPLNHRIKSLFTFILDPILEPVRYLLRHSIFNTPRADLSPMIGFIIIIFLQEFFKVLL